MALVRWDPFRDIITLRERMDRMFEDSLSRFRIPEEATMPTFWSPSVDIYETDENIVLKAELPGVDKKEVSVEVKDNTLILKGERKREKEVKEENYHRVERSFGTFMRSFSLPVTVKQDQVKAKFKDGVLEVTLPKAEEAKHKQVKVEVE
ncbi:MAG: Hsp20/alpha crystallin family protein [Deltaproteobacteria bacterium]|nr:Hsp20/alpha crystallin family protein [Deltaproteobacteria bacterium]